VTMIDFNKNCIDLNIKLVPIHFFHISYWLLNDYFCIFLFLLLFFLVLLLYCLICYSLSKFYDYSIIPPAYYITHLIASALWLYNNFILIFFCAGIENCLLRWFVFIIYLLYFLMDLVFYIVAFLGSINSKINSALIIFRLLLNIINAIQLNVHKLLCSSL